MLLRLVGTRSLDALPRDPTLHVELVGGTLSCAIRHRTFEEAEHLGPICYHWQVAIALRSAGLEVVKGRTQANAGEVFALFRQFIRSIPSAQWILTPSLAYPYNGYITKFPR